MSQKLTIKVYVNHLTAEPIEKWIYYDIYDTFFLTKAFRVIDIREWDINDSLLICERFILSENTK